MTDRIRSAWLSLPAWARSFAIDFAEGGLAAVVVLNVAIPRTLSEATALGAVLAAALATPLIAAARRNVLPAVKDWLSTTFPRP